MPDQVKAVEREAAVPPFPSLEAVRFMHGELLKRQRETSNSPRFHEEVIDFVRRAQVTGSLLDTDETRHTAQTLIDYWVTSLYRATREEREEVVLWTFDPDAGRVRELDDDEYPYHDVARLEADESGLLLATTRLVSDACERIDKHRLAAIVGPSGSGKSTLMVQVLTALKSGAAVGSANWNYLPEIAPGALPLVNLADLFCPADDLRPQWIAQQIKLFMEDAGHLKKLVDEYGEGQTLLVLDHFDDVFRLCHDHLEAQALFDNLVGLIAAPNCTNSLLLVMDSDFLGQIDDLDSLKPFFQQGLVYVSHTSDELREAIEKPAKLIGLRFDEGVVDRLILDVQGDPASLTLLHFTLWQLWQRRHHDRITWDTYNQVGGGRRAVQRTGEAVFKDLDEKQQRIVKHVVLQLVSPGARQDLITRRVARKQLHGPEYSDEMVDQVVDRLISSQLLRVHCEGTPPSELIAIAHPALVGHWPRVVEWLAEQRDHMRRRLRLSDAARTWSKRGRDCELLWRGSLLDEAETYSDLDRLEAMFVEESREAVKRAEVERIAAAQKETRQAQELAAEEKRRAAFERKARVSTQRLALVLAIGIVILAVAAFVTFRAHQDEKKARESSDEAHRMEQEAHLIAREQKEEAQLQSHRAHFQSVKLTVAHGTQLLEAGDASGAALWFAEALRKEQDKRNYSAPQVLYRQISAGLLQQPLLKAMWHQSPPEGVMPKLKDPSKYQTWIAEFGRGGELAIIANGELGGQYGEARLYDVQAGNPIRTFVHHDGPVISADIRSDGKMVVTGSRSDGSTKGKIKLWDPDPDVKDPLLEVDTTGAVFRVVFSPDGKYVAVASSVPPDGQSSGRGATDQRSASILGAVRIWDVSTKSPTELNLKIGGYLRWVAFNHDSSKIVVAGIDSAGAGGFASVWDFKNDPSRPENSLSRGNRVTRVEFGPQGQYVVTAGGKQGDDSGEATIWKWQEKSAASEVLLHHPTGVTSARFSPDGLFVVTADFDGSARLWRRDQENELAVFRHGSSVFDSRFSPDGLLLATASRDGTARVWDLATKSQMFPTMHHNGTVSTVSFGADGDLMTASRHFVRVWQLATPDPPPQPLATSGDVQRFECSTFGDYVVTVGSRRGYEAGGCQVWRKVDFVWKLVCQVPVETVQSASFSRDGKFLVTADGNGEVTVWSGFEEGSIRKLFPSKTTGIRKFNYVAVGPASSSTDGNQSPRYLAVASGDVAGQKGTVIVWDLASDAIILELGENEHSGAVLSICFNDKGDRMVTASSDDTAKVWNLATRAQVGDAMKHTADVVYATFSPTPPYVVTASLDQTAVVWDYSSKGSDRKVGILPHNSLVTHARFSPDGNYLVTTSHDERGRVWYLGNLSPHSEGETTVEKIGPKIVAVLEHGGDIKQATFDAKGEQVTAVGYFIPRIVGRNGSDLAFGRRLVQLRSWSVAAKITDPKDVKSFPQLLSARWFSGERQSLQRLDQNSLATQWRASHENYKKSLKPDERWKEHYGRAIKAEAAEQWYAAARHLDQLQPVASPPADSKLFALRVRVFGMQQRYDDVEQLTLRVEQPDANVYYWRTLARLGSEIGVDERAGYLEACREMLDRYASAQDRDGANKAVWACALPARDAHVSDRVLEVGERLVAASRKEPFADPALHRCLNTLGAAYYRAGDHQKALAAFLESEREYEKWQKDEGLRNAERYSGKVWNWIFLAMVHQKLHESGADPKADHRRQALEYAQRMDNVLGRDARPTTEQYVDALDVPSPSWDQNLALRLLKEEVDQVLRRPKTPTF